MTKAEYSEYQAAVAAFFEREGLANLSTICDENDGPNESYFTWSGCDCCGRSQGTNAQDCNGYNETTEQVQGPYTVCDDCVYYNEYGQLDDDTMFAIERSEE